MMIWAAIDLMDGSVVTLTKGRVTERKVWSSDALDLAMRWEEEGADGLHVIDLDAAFVKGSNEELVSSIIRRAGIPVQVGGGVRDAETARRLMEKGAARVIVGTMAYKEPSVLRELLLELGPERLVVAADYAGSSIVTRGWTERQGIPLLKAIKALEEEGIENVLTTSVGRDGTGRGPDLAVIGEVCRSTRMKVTASGGIRDAGDLAKLEDAGADGAVVGRALYEEKIKLAGTRRRL